nr:unnamed protein product [Spirometra erinaceieuropaei]
MNYPNIVTQREKCLPARGLNQLHKTLVCDPREILTADEVKLLNRQLLDLQTSLNSDKKACDEAYPRPTIAVALERRMQLGSSIYEGLVYVITQYRKILSSGRGALYEGN